MQAALEDDEDESSSSVCISLLRARDAPSASCCRNLHKARPLSIPRKPPCRLVLEIAELTALPLPVIQLLYSRFRRMAPSGFMSYARFKNSLGMLALLDDAFLPERLFKAFDLMEDGILDFLEWATSMGIMTNGSEEERLELSFRTLKSPERPKNRSLIGSETLAGPLWAGLGENRRRSRDSRWRQLYTKDNPSYRRRCCSYTNSSEPRLVSPIPRNGTRRWVTYLLATDPSDTSNVISLEEFFVIVRSLERTRLQLIGDYKSSTIQDEVIEAVFRSVTKEGAYRNPPLMSISSFKNAVRHSPEFLSLLGVQAQSHLHSANEARFPRVYVEQASMTVSKRPTLDLQDVQPVGFQPLSADTTRRRLKNLPASEEQLGIFSMPQLVTLRHNLLDLRIALNRLSTDERLSPRTNAVDLVRNIVEEVVQAEALSTEKWRRMERPDSGGGQQMETSPIPRPHQRPEAYHSQSPPTRSSKRLADIRRPRLPSNCQTVNSRRQDHLTTVRIANSPSPIHIVPPICQFCCSHNSLSGEIRCPSMSARSDLFDFPQLIGESSPSSSSESEPIREPSPQQHEKRICRQQTLVLPAEPHLMSPHLLNLPSPMESTPTETPRPVELLSPRTQDGKSSNSSGVSSVEEALPLIDTLLQWIQELIEQLDSQSPTQHRSVSLRSADLDLQSNTRQRMYTNPANFNAQREQAAARRGGFVQTQAKVKRRRVEAKILDSGPRGLVVHFGHEAWNMVLNMMVGIRLAATRASLEPMRNVEAYDFLMKEKFSILPKASNVVDKLSRYDYSAVRFIDYAPMVFRKLRESMDLESDDYLRSVGPEQLIGNMVLGNLSSLSELCSEGKSGALFYYTADGRFLVKTMTKDAAKFFRRILKPYFEHVVAHPGTMLTRFYGYHAVRLKSSKRKNASQKLYFVVMKNIFHTPVLLHRRYDLKGSWVGRSATVANGFYPKDMDSSIALKDLDFRHIGEKIRLPASTTREFIATLERDATFLAGLGILDYSLLFGIHVRHLKHGSTIPATTPIIHVPSTILEGAQEDGDSTCSLVDGGGGASQTDNNSMENDSPYPWLEARGMLSSDKRAIYFCGLIDVFTRWTAAKKLEHALKSTTSDPRGISCVNPNFYAERFINFIKVALDG